MKFISLDNQNRIMIVEKDEFFANYDNFRHMIESDKQSYGMTTRLLLTRSPMDKSSNYVYSSVQMELLHDLDEYYKNEALVDDGIKFSEIFDIERKEDYDVAWNLDTVLLANHKVDVIAREMKKLKLSPFEAVLYAHMKVSEFRYHSTSESTYREQELSRVILGLIGDDPFIVCSGYSSFMMAIFEKFNNKNIRSEFIGLSLINKDTFAQSDHSILSIQLRDAQYGVEGKYFNDATANSAFPIGYLISTCLYPIHDQMYLKDQYAHVLNTNKNNIRNTIISHDIHNLSADDIVVKNKYRHQIEYVCRAYFENNIPMNKVKSDPISIEQYEDALYNIFVKEYYLTHSIPFDATGRPKSEKDEISEAELEKINQLVHDIIDHSTTHARAYFSSFASNGFIRPAHNYTSGV